jgi:Skp family chaperone for outer membrane proteins
MCGSLRAWTVLSTAHANISLGMSAHNSASKAAEIAARQVEQIVDAAQLAAEQIKLDADKAAQERRAVVEAELAKRREAVEAEVEKLRADATREAEKERGEAASASKELRESAAAEAKRLGDQSQTEAAERIAVAEKAADEALADARAISSGLRRLGQSLEDYAEKILRDVQAGHRRLRGDLRIAGGGAPATPGERARRAEPREETAKATRPAPSSGERSSRGRGSPFEEIDVPSWVGPDE